MPALAPPKPKTFRHSWDLPTATGRKDPPGVCRRSTCWSDSFPAGCGPPVFAPEGPAAQARHLGIGPAFIHKDKTGHRFRSQPFMPAISFFGHVQSVLFGGGQSFFLYTSSPVAKAIHRSWKSGRAGPGARPTRPAWRRVAWTAALAAAVSAPWSVACDARSNESAARACRAAETAGAPGVPPPRKNRKIWAISRVPLPRS